MDDVHAKPTFTLRTLDMVARVGNRLPDPLTLFVIFALAIPPISYLAANSGWAVPHPTSGELISPVSLISMSYIQGMFTNAVSNFTSFRPLGVVLVAMIGVGVAEKSGLIAALLRVIVTAVPRSLTTAAVVFAGVMSSMAVDAGYVVLTPLGAVVFAGMGRHPIAGLCAAFAGVSGGFSANLLLTAFDPMLSELTMTAALLYDESYTVQASANYYFMFVSVIMLTLLGWWVTERIVEPYLGTWEGGTTIDEVPSPITVAERKGLWTALAAFLFVIGLFALLTIPGTSLFRGEDGSLGPFYGALIIIITAGFFLPGLFYGIVAGSIKSDRDVSKMAGEAMATMGPYIVLAFAAAQFVVYFSDSNLGLMLALSGASFLKGLGVGGIVLLVGLIAVAGFINLFVGSGSAKWALLAPVFVPLMMDLGYSPELAQVAYRIGDSITNIITPLNPYFPIVLAFAQRYDPKVRLGTIVSAMLPYAVVFGIAWTLLLTAWYLLGIPLGPGAPMMYTP